VQQTGSPRATTQPAKPFSVALANTDFSPSCMKILIRQFIFRKALTWVKIHKVFFLYFALVAAENLSLFCPVLLLLNPTLSLTYFIVASFHNACLQHYNVSPTSNHYEGFIVLYKCTTLQIPHSGCLQGSHCWFFLSPSGCLGLILKNPIL